MATIKEINQLLPQTQCGECGYKGCEPYALALAQGTAPINKCPPGGVDTVIALGRLLQKDPSPYLESAKNNTRLPAKAIIDETECIGCTKCIQACPVDAIIGSSKQMHAIIEIECTGCGLCIEPCPVDCIELITLPNPVYDKQKASEHYQAKKIRLLREEQLQQQAWREKIQQKNTEQKTVEIEEKHNYIAAALARVKAKKS